MNLQLENVVKIGDGDIYALTILDPNIDVRFTVKVNKSNSKADLLEKIKTAYLVIVQKSERVLEIDGLLRTYVENLDSSGW